MPFDGSGNYVVPAGTAGVPNTVIDSTKYNTLLSDLQTALTLCVTRNGQSAAQANLPMGGFKLTGLGAGVTAGDSLRWEQLFSQGAETAIVSAATLDIGAVNTSFLRVTGSTGPITSLGTNYNGPRWMRFTDAAPAVLTYNATTLLTQTSANISLAQNDIVLAWPKATSTTPDGWQTLVIRASGASVLGVTPAQLQTQTYTAFTTAGTATAYTLTPAPALSALTAGQRFRVKMDQANSGTTPTLAVSGLAATAIKMYVTDGTKRDPVAGELAANLLVDMEYDGTNWVARAIPPQLATATPAVGTAAGTVGTGLDAARGNHAHPPMSGSVIQVAYAGLTTYTSSTTVMTESAGVPPTNTQGEEELTLAFTPKLASSTLRIRVRGSVIVGGSYRCCAALFVDSTANALAAHVGTNAPIDIEYYVSAASTSARTYKLRIGPSAAGTIYINGNFGGSIGGLTMSVDEIAA